MGAGDFRVSHRRRLAKHRPGLRRHLLDARRLVSTPLGMAGGPVGRCEPGVLQAMSSPRPGFHRLLESELLGWNRRGSGGALIFGALPRIMKKPRLRDALWLALGMAILANSRPFEGLVVSIPVVVILGIWIIRTRGISWRIRFLRVVLPVVLGPPSDGRVDGFYNFRVTGNPFLHAV